MSFKVISVTAPMKKLTNSGWFSWKPLVPILKEFRKESAKNCQPSKFWKPFNMGTGGFRDLFYDCTSGFLYLPIGIDLENNNDFHENWHTFIYPSFIILRNYEKEETIGIHNLFYRMY